MIYVQPITQGIFWTPNEGVLIHCTCLGDSRSPFSGFDANFFEMKLQEKLSDRKVRKIANRYIQVGMAREHVAVRMQNGYTQWSIDTERAEITSLLVKEEEQYTALGYSAIDFHYDPAKTSPAEYRQRIIEQAGVRAKV